MPGAAAPSVLPRPVTASPLISTSGSFANDGVRSEYSAGFASDDAASAASSPRGSPSPRQQPTLLTAAASVDGMPRLTVCESVELPKGIDGTTPAKGGPPPALASRLATKVHQHNQPPGAIPMTPPVTAAQADAAGISHADSSTGLDLPSPLQLFLMYDTDRTYALGPSELRQMLFDLDGLDGVPPSEVDAYVAREFESADMNHDSKISIDEFYFYFYKSLCFKFPVVRTGVNPGADLQLIFMKYCGAGTGGVHSTSTDMGSRQFCKLCQDAKLLTKRVRKADMDLIYSRARAETEVLEVQEQRPGAEWTTAKLTYAQFLFALLRLAEKRRSGFQEVVACIISNVTAVPAPSMADLIIFRNTGEPQQLDEWLRRPRGLPALPRVVADTSVRFEREAALAQSLKLPGHKTTAPSATAGALDASGQPPDLSAHLASIEQRKKWGLESYGSADALGLSCTGRAALDSPAALLAVRTLDPDHMVMALKRTFELYNQWEHGLNKSAMDRLRWAKMLRDARFVCERGPLSIAVVDSIFNKVLPSAKSYINFIEFMQALRHAAACLRTSLNEVIERIVLVNAPLP